MLKSKRMKWLLKSNELAKKQFEITAKIELKKKHAKIALNKKN